MLFFVTCDRAPFSVLRSEKRQKRGSYSNTPGEGERSTLLYRGGRGRGVLFYTEGGGGEGYSVIQRGTLLLRGGGGRGGEGYFFIQ